MKNFVDITTKKTPEEVLEAISAATEREIIPFVFTVEGPARKPKPFVSKVRGNKFRVWRTPPRSKASNHCYPYLRGEVRDVNGERHLIGTFALHPFHRVFELVPVAVVALALCAWPPTVPILIFIAFSCAFEFLTIASRRQRRPKEESDILAFLRALFPENVE